MRNETQETQSTTTLSKPMQQAFDSINTRIEAHKIRLEQRLQIDEHKARESLNTYNESYY